MESRNVLVPKRPDTNMSTQNQYAIMQWPTDENKLSIHHLKHITQPKKSWNEYSAGDTGMAKYGSAEWEYKILAVGPTRQSLSKKLQEIIKHREEQENDTTETETCAVPRTNQDDRQQSSRHDDINIRELHHDATAAATSAILRMRNSSILPVPELHAVPTASTSELMGGAFETLYGQPYQVPRDYSMTVEQTSTCHSCCSILQQLMQEVEQLKGEVERLKRKRKPSQSQTPDVEDEPCHLFNGKTKEHLEGIVEATSNISEAVKRLFKEMFTVEEIKTQSVLGRHTNKKHAKKAGLDEAKRNLMEELLLKKFGVSLMEARSKMRDRMKILKRNYSEVSTAAQSQDPSQS